MARPINPCDTINAMAIEKDTNPFSPKNLRAKNNSHNTKNSTDTGTIVFAFTVRRFKISENMPMSIGQSKKKNSTKKMLIPVAAMKQLKTFAFGLKSSNHAAAAVKGTAIKIR
ncbi:MAG TPA: hypothetical protein VF676_10480 [Flavobacterium sp.]|jgi:hypothetical protein